jgi:hypothetical protein
MNNSLARLIHAAQSALRRDRHLGSLQAGGMLNLTLPKVAPAAPTEITEITAVATAPAAAEPPAPPRVEVKIESTRCDLHPLYVLRPAKIDILLPGSDAPAQVRAEHCPKQGCDRHYLSEHGYFPFVPGETSTIGGSDERLRCTVHEDYYMALAKTNVGFAWACLHAGCTHSAPYQEPSAFEPWTGAALPALATEAWPGPVANPTVPSGL